MTRTPRLEPLRGFELIGDLAVRMEAFYRDIEPGGSYLKPALPPAPDEAVAGTALLRFEGCIECGCCVSARSATRSRRDFMGPAALAALHNEISKNPRAADDLLRTAGNERGSAGASARWPAAASARPGFSRPATSPTCGGT
jgi:succinate dehydrogenase/fumarate reductase-like Fe-S protein